MRHCTTWLIVVAAAGLALSGCGNPAELIAPADLQRTDDSDRLTPLPPTSALLESAMLHLYIQDASERVVTLHRIASDWSEGAVSWYNFAGGYYPEPESFFFAEQSGWLAVDVTGAVQAWLAGEVENFGLVMKQEPLAAPYTTFPSREAPANQPYLELRYSTAAGEVSEIHPPIADTLIWEYIPWLNFGMDELLYAGWPTPAPGVEMQALIRFETPVPPEDVPGDDPGCTLGLGYWRTHAGPESWNHPDEVSALLPLWLGEPGGDASVLVGEAEIAREILAFKTPGGPANGIIALRAALLAVKLNVARGAEDADIAQAVGEADAFLASHGHGDWPALTKSEQIQVRGWKDLCESYNEGEIGPGSCASKEPQAKR